MDTTTQTMAFTQSSRAKKTSTSWESSISGTDRGLSVKAHDLLPWCNNSVFFSFSSSLDIWLTKYTNMINGSDGTLAPPFVLDESSTVYLFSTDVCRSVPSRVATPAQSALLSTARLFLQDGVREVRFEARSARREAEPLLGAARGVPQRHPQPRQRRLLRARRRVLGLGRAQQRRLLQRCACVSASFYRNSCLMPMGCVVLCSGRSERAHRHVEPALPVRCRQVQKRSRWSQREPPQSRH